MSMYGIDVSAWQPGNITGLVDLDFAIIKATEGIGYVSPLCDQQYQIAKSRGKALGVYHFLSGYDAAAEADYFIDNIQGYLGEAVIVFDYEADAINCGREWLRKAIRRAKDRTGTPPIIYASLSVVQSQALDKLCADEDCGLWVAAYPHNGRVGYQEADMLGGVIRQYTSSGALNGYAGNLDLNYSILTVEEWAKYAHSSVAGSPAPSVSKSNDEIAGEVMNGAWGNGDDRRSRLSAAGYDPDTIQAIVNKKYERKDNNTLANEVIAGAWGMGDDRRNRLKEQGYDYDAIQSIVNDKLNVQPQGKNYTIQPGDILSVIAANNGTSVAQLVAWNRPFFPSMTANYIQAGWTIKVG